MKGYTEKAAELVTEWRHDIGKQELGDDQVLGELSRRIATAMAEMCEPICMKLEETVREREDWNSLHQQACLQIAKLRPALESIAANTCCDRCQEAALVAQETLRQL